jgi:hypothetical protein
MNEFCIVLSTDVCLDVWMFVCNEMDCDETANDTNVPIGTNIPSDNRNQTITLTLTLTLTPTI